jgi:hypothetical protein
LLKPKITMSIKQLIVADIEKIDDPLLLNQLLGYLQIMKRASAQMSSNRGLFLSCAGSISDETADDLQKTIREEF